MLELNKNNFCGTTQQRTTSILSLLTTGILPPAAFAMLRYAFDGVGKTRRSSARDKR